MGLTSTGFCHEHALILYVYLPSDNGAEESVLTASIPVRVHCASLTV